MADHRSAEVFGEMFKKLATGPTDVRALAAELWAMTPRYDFTDDQMGADDALMALGLARWVEVDGETGIEYGPAEGALKPPTGELELPAVCGQLRERSIAAHFDGQWSGAVRIARHAGGWETCVEPTCAADRAALGMEAA